MNQIANKYITEANGRLTVHVELSAAVDPVELEDLRARLDRMVLAADAGPKIGAGVVLMASSGKVLLLLRAATEMNYGGHWGLPGGKADEGETPEETACRECLEETGFAPAVGPGTLKDLGTVTTPTGFAFTTFLATAPGEFEPTLGDGEHTDHMWADPAQLPEKIHPGVKETLEKLVASKPGAADAIALDKDTVRSIDDVGRLHVASAHISKAAVNPYYGREIPNWQELGLDPERTYQMFRDPAELEKAAETFEGIQVLIRHIPVSADDHRPDEIVGTTGTSAKFNAPYLDNELVIWTQTGIDAIESGAQRELSCGYGYTPVMEPGTFEGTPYDGRMTNIRGNHVALVEKGRAGPDVVVGDAALQSEKEITMSTKPLSRTAALVRAALSAHLLPKIALDQQLKVSTSLASGLLAINAKNFKDQKKAIVKLAKDAAEPALTAEAKKAGGVGPDDVIMRVLDMVDGQVEGDDAEEMQTEMDSEPGSEWRKAIMDACMKAGMDEKSAGAICDMFPKPKAEDADKDDEEESAEEKAKREKAEKDEKAKSEKAMDEAITTAVNTAVQAERQRSKDASEARQFVEPWVGKVSLAHDSAEDIYRAALGMLNVKHEAVKDGAALKILVEAQPKPGQRQQTFATDAAPLEGKAFTDMFPGADRIGHAA